MANRKLLTTQKGLAGVVFDDGWTNLFKDPNDNRLWELTYSSSDSHGGGAPVLSLVSLDEARSKYTNFSG
ncbi:Imm27 family immunity protein [Pseudidiomarina sp. GXY010]|uniref:Imm27 family immunity protein n=1 Tax=Pseudidiomarina fusca TaxID=2965078 RepID=A0ABU3KZ93_9GAMM|nr:Imm27 family immunity protein [Pseudidiomarina sp. GXY010]